MAEVPQVLWWSAGIASFDGSGAPAYETLTAVCSQQERETAGRFMFERDRRAYLAAHGLLRHALSACDPRHAAQAWTFTRTPHGRPELDVRFASPIRFNLSHCATRVSCVVVPLLDCGIDVEPLARQVDTEALQKECLSQGEQRWVRGGGEQAQAARFMRLWTLKEALAKAVGLGLSLPFPAIEFETEPVPRLRGKPAGVKDAWWLALHEPGDGHVEALALGLPGECAVALSRREWPHPPRLVQGDSRALGAPGILGEPLSGRQD